jgi:hypothetical protein
VEAREHITSRNETGVLQLADRPDEAAVAAGDVPLFERKGNVVSAGGARALLGDLLAR